eukprot:gene22644-29792_t
MERFEFVENLGEGSYGTVWKCYDRESGQLFAVKRFKDAHTDPLALRLAGREMDILKRCDHPNIIRLVEAVRSKSGRIYAVMECAERTLTDELHMHPRGFQPDHLKLVMWQLLQATDYLHKSGVMHRDLKPANILLNADLTVKLCDFGFARKMVSNGAAPYTGYVVTRWYRAPEILVGDHYGPSADVWSLGCLLAEMASGRPLFPGKNAMDQLWLSLKTVGNLTPLQTAVMMWNPAMRKCTIPSPEEQVPLKASQPVPQRQHLRNSLPSCQSSNNMQPACPAAGDKVPELVVRAFPPVLSSATDCCVVPKPGDTQESSTPASGDHNSVMSVKPLQTLDSAMPLVQGAAMCKVLAIGKRTALGMGPATGMGSAMGMSSARQSEDSVITPKGATPTVQGSRGKGDQSNSPVSVEDSSFSPYAGAIGDSECMTGEQSVSGCGKLADVDASLGSSTSSSPYAVAKGGSGCMAGEQSVSGCEKLADVCAALGSSALSDEVFRTAPGLRPKGGSEEEQELSVDEAALLPSSFSGPVPPRPPQELEASWIARKSGKISQPSQRSAMCNRKNPAWNPGKKIKHHFKNMRAAVESLFSPMMDRNERV